MVLEYTATELAEILKTPVSDLEKNRSLKGRAMQYGMYIFGSIGDCSGCKDSFKNFYTKLKTEGMTALENKIKRDFDLKPGYVAQLKFGSSVHISNAILTNELAVQFLSINKSRIKVFTKFPEDWEKRVNDYLSGDVEAATQDEDIEIEVDTATQTPEGSDEVTEQTEPDTTVAEPQKNKKKKVKK